MKVGVDAVYALMQYFKKENKAEKSSISLAKANFHSIVSFPQSLDSLSVRYCAVLVITKDTNSYKPL